MSAVDGGKESERRREKASGKGTLRPLADSISVQDAERASKQVQEAIAQQQHQLDDLTRFVEENKSLTEQVLHLPDSVSHQIMVLLGERHYAERSAKQTAEILDRRGKFLSEKIANATAQIADLRAESSFISNAAEEAKAGLVEIREEYDVSEEVRNPASAAGFSKGATPERASDSMASTSASGSSSLTGGAEHDRLMARMSELELAEAAAGQEDSEDEEVSNNDETGGASLPFRSRLHRTLMTGKGKVLGDDDSGSEETDEGESERGSSDDGEEEEEEEEEDSDEDNQLNLGVEGVVGTEDDHGGIDQSRGVADKQADESLKRALSRFGREVSFEKGSSYSQHAQRESTSEDVRTSKAQVVVEEPRKEAERADILQDIDDSNKDVREWRNDGDHRKGHVLAERQGSEYKSNVSSVRKRRENQVDEENAASHLKAFTGQVTEHGFAEGASSRNEQAQESQPSRPISKFKMRQAQAGRR